MINLAINLQEGLSVMLITIVIIFAIVIFLLMILLLGKSRELQESIQESEDISSKWHNEIEKRNELEREVLRLRSGHKEVKAANDPKYLFREFSFEINNLTGNRLKKTITDQCQSILPLFFEKLEEAGLIDIDIQVSRDENNQFSLLYKVQFNTDEQKEPSELKLTQSGWIYESIAQTIKEIKEDDA